MSFVDRLIVLVTLWAASFAGNVLANLVQHVSLMRAVERSFFQAVVLGMVLLLLSRGVLK